MQPVIRPRIPFLFSAFIAVMVLSWMRPVIGDQVRDHPQGESTVNHGSERQLSEDGVHVRYVINFAELPVLEPIHEIDGADQNSVEGADLD